MKQAPQTALGQTAEGGVGLSIGRRFTEPGVHPFDAIEWERRDARIGHGDKLAFEQRERRVPQELVAERHQHRRPEVLPRADRLARARALGQADDRPRRRHDRRLGPRARLLRDRARTPTPSRPSSPTSCCTRWRRSTRPSGSTWASRSPRSARPASSSRSRTRWSRSSTGTPRRARSSAAAPARASTSRTSAARWSRWPRAAPPRGPVSFMRGADSWAGTIKSGGKTRRAAKMVVLDVDHPDIRDFIWCKASEEDKAEALRDAGFDMSIDGDGLHLDPVPERQQLGARDRRRSCTRSRRTASGALIARTTGEPVGEPMEARELMREIAEAAWRCADPGVQYDTTINQLAHVPELRAHQRVQPLLGVHARRRLGLQPGLAEPDEVPPAGRDASTWSASSTPSTSCCWRRRSSSGPSSYPTEEIGANARAFRQLGLGYANLGAYLMADGMPYDSDEGRGDGGGDHRADDRAGLPPARREIGGGDRPLRALRGEPRARTTT